MMMRSRRAVLVRSAALLAAIVGIAAVVLIGQSRGAPSRSGVAHFSSLNALEPNEGAVATPAARPLLNAPDTIVNRGSATIGPGSLTTSWAGENVAADTAGELDDECNAAADPPINAGRCDDFFLTVNTATRSGSFTVDVAINSPEDYDLYVYDKDNELVGSSGLGQTGNPNLIPEVSTVPCPSAARSPYKVRIVYFQTLADPTSFVYHATATFNNSGDCPVSTPTYNDNALTFAPSTLVSAHFLGVEPQVTMERTNAPGVPQGNPGGISDGRVFVDWPLSSRSNIGQLNRSTDGGDSFRLLFDPTCAARSRPMCITGGGGDTEADINPKNGHVFFADQEVLANEAIATSLDHGDTFTFQTALSNVTSATDRQWVGGTDSSQQLGGQTIEGIFSYHVPPNAYVHAIPESTHLPLPQPIPQLANTGQTGQLKVDNNPQSPGYGWIYYPYRGFVGAGPAQAGTNIATAKTTAFQLPVDWHPHQVEPAGADSFPWVAIDSAGNAYVSFDTGGAIYYSYSLISDPRNNPKATPAGVPGTIWSFPVKVSPAGVTSAIFPEVIAGVLPGTIGVTYLGTNENSGDPGNADPDDHWDTYATVITGANTANPVVNTGIVSHRTSHQGNICTHGTTCGLPPNPPTEDRSLADMIDVGTDAQGRLGIVFQDNFTESFQDNEATPDTSPFVYFAKQITGPTLAGGTVNVTPPTGARDDQSGDATWPNKAGTPNIPGLDIRRTSLNIEGTNLVAHLRLADASPAAMTGAITSYNAATCTAPCQAQRLQYLVRFNTVDEAFHMSLEVLPNGTTRAFGGKLDANDGIVNPGNPQSIIAAGYHTDAGYTVTPTITPGANGEIVLSAPASQFGLVNGKKVFSVTGLATAGPLENQELAATVGGEVVVYIMRTVDASPPFDGTLGQTPTAVQLRSFRASPTVGSKGRSVSVRWRTGAEPGLVGFNLYRVVGAKQTWLNRTSIPSAQRTGGSAYSWRDRLPKAVTGPCYRLQSVQLDGVRRWLGRTCIAGR